MRFNIFLLLAICVLVCMPSINCLPSMQPCSKERCPQTEYSAYIKCITGHTRSKRQAPCYYDYQVTGPDCQARYQLCLRSCTYVNGCSQRCPPCPLQPTNQLHVMQNHASLVPLPPCTGSQCLQQPNRTALAPAGHNVTTIIHLTNHVNNTNIVHVPTHINNTNINNIHMNDTAEGTEETRVKDKCCIVVYKHSCHYGHCRYSRRNSCGPHCHGESKIMHSNSYLHCHGSNCKTRRTYIPQPAAPSCVHSQNWPYVQCGSRRRHAQKYCYGCYDHYGYNYEEYHSERGSPKCEGCYDDGYDQGPLYRHGPFYQPGYYHQPMMQFGVFYQPMIYPIYPLHMPTYGPYPPIRSFRRRNFDSLYSEDEDDEDDYDYSSEEDEAGDIDAGYKCKIVSHNGTSYACDHNVHHKNIYTKRNLRNDHEQNHSRRPEEAEKKFPPKQKHEKKHKRIFNTESEADTKILIVKKDLL